MNLSTAPNAVANRRARLRSPRSKKFHDAADREGRTLGTRRSQRHQHAAVAAATETRGPTRRGAQRSGPGRRDRSRDGGAHGGVVADGRWGCPWAPSSSAAKVIRVAQAMTRSTTALGPVDTPVSELWAATTLTEGASVRGRARRCREYLPGDYAQCPCANARRGAAVRAGSDGQQRDHVHAPGTSFTNASGTRSRKAPPNRSPRWTSKPSPARFANSPPGCPSPMKSWTMSPRSAAYIDQQLRRGVDVVLD